MEATIVYWGYIGVMENKMETTIIENQMEKKMENEMETWANVLDADRVEGYKRGFHFMFHPLVHVISRSTSLQS